MLKYEFSYDEWEILNGLLVRPDKDYLLRCLDASMDTAGREQAPLWTKELWPVLAGLRDKVADMSEDMLRDIFSYLPVDASLGVSVYRFDD